MSTGAWSGSGSLPRVAATSSGSGASRTPFSPVGSPPSPRPKRYWPRLSRASSSTWWPTDEPHRQSGPTDLSGPTGTELPPLLLRPGDLGLGDLDARCRPGPARPLGPAPREWLQRRSRHGAAVPADAAARQLGRTDRGPGRQATSPLRDPVRIGV